MIKIQSFNLNGIRGVKTDCSVELDGKSVLFYGESGAGKSSISDVFEWFFHDRIGHLSGDEIPHSGMLEALRNISLDDDIKSLFSVKFNNSSFNSGKVIYFKKDSLVTEYSNKSIEFKDFLDDSQKENFILRHEDLTKFVLSPKGEKLKALSDIIGFSEVTRIRGVLKKIVNELERTVRINNFDNSIHIQQGYLLEYLGENIINETQFINSINELIKPLNIDLKISSLNDIDNVLNLITKPNDSKKIELQSFYVKVRDLASSLRGYIVEIEKLYKTYYDQFQKIVSDIKKFQKIMLANLLSEGHRVLKNAIFIEEKCPLCLQPKNRSELLKELDIRINELEAFKNERDNLEESRTSLKNVLSNLYPLLNSLLSDTNFKSEDNATLKEMTETLKKYFDGYLAESAMDISKLKELKKADELKFDMSILDKITNFSEKRINQLKLSMENNLILETSSKIDLSRRAYLEVKRIDRVKNILDTQILTMKLAYSEFVKRQQEGLNSFLSLFSKDINDLYQFMNPDEKVDEIEFLPIEKDDELTGITIQFQFFKNKVKPPHKFLSESHLNCLGIAFFLTSVRAFNKQIRFLIIDDVISSFDTNHRIRFADLLLEKFLDYQIILLTHEKNWFDYINNSLKGKDWIINSIKWSVDSGTHIDEPPKILKERIEDKINKSEEEGLGNDIRKYLEYLLKLIAANLKVKVEFRFNDKNEDRMSNELLTCLISEIYKQPCEDLKTNLAVKRLLNSLFIGTKNSHDSSFIPKMGDFKVFWKDVKDLEELFYCTFCNRYISMKYYDEVNKEIRCGCNKKAYKWKK